MDLETVIVVEHIAALTPGMAVTQAELILEEILAEQPLEILAEQPRAQQVAGILEEQHLEEIAAGALVETAEEAQAALFQRQTKRQEAP